MSRDAHRPKRRRVTTVPAGPQGPGPTAQPLPDYLSYSALEPVTITYTYTSTLIVYDPQGTVAPYETAVVGTATTVSTGYSIVNVPLTYTGPSIPLGTDWITPHSEGTTRPTGGRGSSSPMHTGTTRTGPSETRATGHASRTRTGTRETTRPSETRNSPTRTGMATRTGTNRPSPTTRGRATHLGTARTSPSHSSAHTTGSASDSTLSRGSVSTNSHGSSTTGTRSSTSVHSSDSVSTLPSGSIINVPPSGTATQGTIPRNYAARLSGGQIAGIVIGSLAALLLLLLCCCVWRRRRNARRRRAMTEADNITPFLGAASSPTGFRRWRTGVLDEGAGEEGTYTQSRRSKGTRGGLALVAAALAGRRARGRAAQDHPDLGSGGEEDEHEAMLSGGSVARRGNPGSGAGGDQMSQRRGLRDMMSDPRGGHAYSAVAGGEELAGAAGLGLAGATLAQSGSNNSNSSHTHTSSSKPSLPPPPRAPRTYGNVSSGGDGSGNESGGSGSKNGGRGGQKGSPSDTSNSSPWSTNTGRFGPFAASTGSAAGSAAVASRSVRQEGQDTESTGLLAGHDADATRDDVPLNEGDVESHRIPSFRSPKFGSGDLGLGAIGHEGGLGASEVAGMGAVGLAGLGLSTLGRGEGEERAPGRDSNGGRRGGGEGVYHRPPSITSSCFGRNGARDSVAAEHEFLARHPEERIGANTPLLGPAAIGAAAAPQPTLISIQAGGSVSGTSAVSSTAPSSHTDSLSLPSSWATRGSSSGSGGAVSGPSRNRVGHRIGSPALSAVGEFGELAAEEEAARRAASLHETSPSPVVGSGAEGGSSVQKRPYPTGSAQGQRSLGVQPPYGSQDTGLYKTPPESSSADPSGANTSSVPPISAYAPRASLIESLGDRWRRLTMGQYALVLPSMSPGPRSGRGTPQFHGHDRSGSISGETGLSAFSGEGSAMLQDARRHASSSSARDSFDRRSYRASVHDVEHSVEPSNGTGSTRDGGGSEAAYSGLSAGYGAGHLRQGSVRSSHSGSGSGTGSGSGHGRGGSSSLGHSVSNSSSSGSRSVRGRRHRQQQHPDRDKSDAGSDVGSIASSVATQGSAGRRASTQAPPPMPAHDVGDHVRSPLSEESTISPTIYDGATASYPEAGSAEPGFRGYGRPSRIPEEAEEEEDGRGAS